MLSQIEGQGEGQIVVAGLKLLQKRLRLGREERGLSLEETAERLGVDANTVWRYEAGRVMIPIDRLLHLAQIYGRSSAWFLGEAPGQVAPAQDGVTGLMGASVKAGTLIKELLGKAVPFRYLTDEELGRLGQNAEPLRLDSGELVGACGAAEGGVYLVAQGSVGCFIRLEHGGRHRELELATLVRYECIVRVTRPVSSIFFRAKEPTELLYVASSLISSMGKDDPFLTERLSQGLTRYFAATSRFFAQRMDAFLNLRRKMEKLEAER